MTFLYEKFGTPWRHLWIFTPPKLSAINMEAVRENSEENESNGDSDKHQDGVKIHKNMVCTVTQSFMVESRAEIQQKFPKTNKLIE